MTNNIVLFENAFIGKDIKKPEKVLKKLNKDSKKLKQYFLVAFVDDSSRVEIISSRLLNLKYHKDKMYNVLGLFTSEDDAFEYIRCITEISYSIYDDFCPLRVIKEVKPEEIDALYYKEEEAR